MISSLTGATWFLILANTFLVLLKLSIGVAIGSIAVISDALDSASDLISGIVAFIGIRISSRPPDWNHPFGHGKAENVSSFIESLFIAGTGTFVVYEALHRIRSGAEIHHLWVGIAAMGISIAVNLLGSREVFRVARRTGSLALEAAAKHRFLDVFVSGGVLVGLLVVRFAGLTIVDPIIALAVAGLIFWTALGILRKTIAGLMDTSLPAHECTKIEETVKGSPDVVQLLQVRTRRAGRDRHIDLEVALHKLMSVGEAQRVCSDIEARLLAHFPGSYIVIRTKPSSPGREESPSR